MTTIIRRRKLGMSSCRGIAAFSKTGIGWVRSDRELPDDDLYIRWGCTTNVPTNNVLNTAKAIHKVNDKGVFRKLLSDNGLAPDTFFNYEDISIDDLDSGIVVRPHKHSQGRQLYTVYNRFDLTSACFKAGYGYYCANLIRKVSEYRIFVVQGRVACVAEKTPGNPDDVAWNVAKGGRFDVTPWDKWPLRACKTAIEAFMLSGLDFGGVDVMLDAKGKPYVLEINSAPSLTSPYRQKCMAKCFDWIVEKDKAIIPVIEERGGYLKFIHPAVCDRSQLVKEDV